MLTYAIKSVTTPLAAAQSDRLGRRAVLFLAVWIATGSRRRLEDIEVATAAPTGTAS